MNDLLTIMKALSDETRFKIIDYLLNYDFCVGALSRQLGISEAAVSQQLRVLRNAGIVTGEKRGYYTHYDVNRQILLEAANALTAVATNENIRKDCRQHLTGDHQYCLNKKLPVKKK